MPKQTQDVVPLFSFAFSCLVPMPLVKPPLALHFLFYFEYEFPEKTGFLGSAVYQNIIKLVSGNF